MQLILQTKLEPLMRALTEVQLSTIRELTIMDLPLSFIDVIHLVQNLDNLKTKSFLLFKIENSFKRLILFKYRQIYQQKQK